MTDNSDSITPSTTGRLPHLVQTMDGTQRMFDTAEEADQWLQDHRRTRRNQEQETRRHDAILTIAQAADQVDDPGTRRLLFDALLRQLRRAGWTEPVVLDTFTPCVNVNDATFNLFATFADYAWKRHAC